jgi:dTMP kinase
MNKGRLIVIDGTDGSGKATQLELLRKRLESESIKVKTIDFPRYKNNQLGTLIRECLDGLHGDFIGFSPKVASVLYAADRYESSGLIKEWIKEGFIVLADRYVSANQIHQGGKINEDEQRKVFLKWLDDLEHGVFDLPRPDAIFYLHLPIDLSIRLIVERAKIENIDPDLAESNAKHLLESQQSAVSIVKDNNDWFKIDCATEDEKNIKSREEIHEMIWAKLQPFI